MLWLGTELSESRHWIASNNAFIHLATMIHGRIVQLRHNKNIDEDNSQDGNKEQLILVHLEQGEPKLISLVRIPVLGYYKYSFFFFRICRKKTVYRFTIQRYFLAIRKLNMKVTNIKLLQMIINALFGYFIGYFQQRIAVFILKFCLRLTVIQLNRPGLIIKQKIYSINVH